MSWQKHFVKYKPNVDHSANRSSNTKTSRIFSKLPELYAGDPKRINRYSQYDDMDKDVISSALDITADFCTQMEERNDRRILAFRFKSEPTEQEVVVLKHALEKWIELNDFSRNLWHVVRNTILYGDQFFIRDPETYAWIWVDPRKVSGVVVDESRGKKAIAYVIDDMDVDLVDHIATHQNITATNDIRVNHGLLTLNQSSNTVQSSRFNTQQNQTMVSADFIIHISLSVGMDNVFPFGVSILEPVFKTFVQKSLLEDAMLIYRVQRAPERRVFYIDTGDMRPDQRMAYLEKIKNEIHQQRVPSRNSKGGITSDGTLNPLSLLDDYFFAQGIDGRGSKVEVLPGGEGLANIDDLKYFNNNLIRGLGVPANYISTGPEDQQSVFSDGKSGAGLQQELRFSRYCMRLQSIVAKPLDKEFKRYLAGIGVEIDLGFFELQFNPPQNFAQFAQIERDTAQIQVFQPLSEIKWLSKRFIQKRFLNLTDEEIEENIRLWKEENATKIKNNNNTSLDPDTSGDAAALGLRASDSTPSVPTDMTLSGAEESDLGGDMPDMGDEIGGTPPGPETPANSEDSLL